MDYAKIAPNQVTSFDFETHKIQPGLLTPPIVCGSFHNKASYALLPRKEAVEATKELLKSTKLVVGANLAYDFGCACAEDPSLVQLVFDKYEKGEIFDVLIAQTLDAIARGLLRDETGKKMLVDPRTGGPVKIPSSGKQAFRYSLEVVTDLVLNRTDAKQNDRWRTSYALLEGTPIKDWPPEAKQYPLDDAKNAWDVALEQFKTHRNLHDMPNQAYAAWCLHLGSVWGMRADVSKVYALSAQVNAKWTQALERFQKHGFLREDGSEDQKRVKKVVVAAYCHDLDRFCPHCNAGKVKSPKTGKPINCEPCDGTGLFLPEGTPRTEKGGVKTDRDTLAESGDERLMEYAGVGLTAKIRETYLPFLEEATRTPVNVAPNVLVSTGRTSYDGKIQTIPREGGVRECIIPSKGRVLCSVDYSAIEMCTLAEVMYELLGESRIGDVINASKDPGRLHTDLGARLAGREGDAEFYKNVKLKGSFEEAMRQSGKAGNFGFPGMMGEVKFVHAKRREGIKLCLLTRRASKCGVTKVTEWKGRSYAPTCLECIKTSAWIKREYLDMWRMQAYFNKIQFLLDSGAGEITQLVSKRVRGGCSGPQAANTFFQGLASDGAKRALRLITRESYCERRSPLFGSRLLVFAHDETLMEHRQECAHEAAYRQAELMIQGMKEVVHNVHIVAEPALMTYWSKKAEAVFDSNGRLVPWQENQVASAKTGAQVALV